MEHKDTYTLEEVVELILELEDLGVDFDELDEDTTIWDMVAMSKKLRNV